MVFSTPAGTGDGSYKEHMVSHLHHLQTPTAAHVVHTCGLTTLQAWENLRKWEEGWRDLRGSLEQLAQTGVCRQLHGLSHGKGYSPPQ